jgi:hypothetical protein
LDSKVDAITLPQQRTECQIETIKLEDEMKDSQSGLPNHLLLSIVFWKSQSIELLAMLFDMAGRTSAFIGKNPPMGSFTDTLCNSNLKVIGKRRENDRIGPGRRPSGNTKRIV